MKVDTTTPEGMVRTIVVPNNVPYVSRFVSIKKDEYVCDQEVSLYAPVSTWSYCVVLFHTMSILK